MGQAISELVKLLRPKEQRGSKPRCHLLTHGPRDVVATRLTALASPFATVSPCDHWMPDGFANRQEAQLHQATRLLDGTVSDQLKAWWLGPASQRAMTPNFDIASTCLIDGARGLLLVEAKAHDEELNKEAAGRLLDRDSSDDRKASHEKIGAAIEAARTGLEKKTLLPWSISRDTHYQMSNRFAWAWKLTELGFPVVLIYLGFLRANEMADRGKPFRDHSDWEQLVKSHSQPLFPSQVWERQWASGSTALIPLIVSCEQSLTG